MATHQAEIVDLPAPIETAERQVTKYEEQATDIGVRADALVVKTEADRNAGLAIVGEMKALRDVIEAERTSITGPINQGLKKINAGFKGPVNYLETHYRALEKRCSDWQAEKERKAREDEARRLKVQEARQEKANARAEELGMAPTTVAPPPPRVTAPAQTTQFDDGSSATMKAVKKWRITDESQIPREYWILDEKKLNAVVRAGLEVAGIEIYEEYTSTHRRGV